MTSTDFFPEMLKNAVRVLDHPFRLKIIGALYDQPPFSLQELQAFINEHDKGRMVYHLNELQKSAFIKIYFQGETDSEENLYYSLNKFGKDVVDSLKSILQPTKYSPPVIIENIISEDGKKYLSSIRFGFKTPESSTAKQNEDDIRTSTISSPVQNTWNKFHSDGDTSNSKIQDSPIFIKKDIFAKLIQEHLSRHDKDSIKQ